MQLVNKVVHWRSL